jgi:hypothetical protein
VGTLRLSDRADRMFAPPPEEELYRPQRGRGSFDGYESGLDLIIGMLHQRTSPDYRQDRRAAETNTVGDRNGYVPTADGNLDASQFGDTNYMNWAMGEAAKEVGVPERQINDENDQISFLREMQRTLESRGPRDNRERTLTQLLTRLLAQRTGS